MTKADKRENIIMVWFLFEIVGDYQCHSFFSTITDSQ